MSERNPRDARSGASPTLSLVIPVFNESKNIPRCLEAIAMQHHQPDQILVVDNGSTDDTIEVVERAFEEYHLRQGVLLTEAIPGPGAARNCGIRAASGELVAFTDADCIPSPNWTERLVEIFTHDHGLTAVGGVERGSENSESVIARLLSATWLPHNGRRPRMIVTDSVSFLEGGVIATFNCCFRREWLLFLGGFDETFFPAGEDADLLLRSLKSGCRVVAWDHCLVVCHEQDLTLSEVIRKMFFYGVASAHLARRHFSGQIHVVGTPFGTLVWRGPTVLLWSSAFKLVAVAALGLGLITIHPGLAFGLVAAVPFRVYRLLVRHGGPRPGVFELGLATLTYVARMIAQQLGRAWGSARYRVLCF